MKAFWVRCGNNFGDELTRLIIETKYKEDLQWCHRKETPFVSTGSLLELMPQDWDGFIVGSGCMWEASTNVLPHAEALLVRGALTAEKVKTSAPLGDPGVIVSDIVPAAEKKHKVGLIPHFIDKELMFTHSYDVVIDIRQCSYDFLQEVSSCEEIVTSSLHGLITADAYGIPRTWVPHDKVLGEGFKFRDYASSLDCEIRPNVQDTAPELRLQELKANVHTAFDELYRRLYGL